jgi:enamine deaminase RidA (YjgF/YER057c/UK114 family)
MTGRQILLPAGWKIASGYSHGISAAGKMVCTAGQIGWNPITMAFETDDFAEQTSQALRNVVAILKAGGARPDHLVRMTWFVTSREEYLQARKAIGATYKEIVGRHYPAMSVVVVSALVEERAKIEIEATAIVP